MNPGKTASQTNAATGRRLELIRTQICDPQGEKEKSMRHALSTIEPRLIELSGQEPLMKVVVGEMDKSRQNPLNKLGGIDALGQQAMIAYWDVAERAISAAADLNGRIALHLIRVAPRSDEGIVIIAGRNLNGSLDRQFKSCWKEERKKTDFAGYSCTIQVPDGGSVREFDLNLEAFSKVLKHPEMICACKYSLSRPIIISPNTREGFISDEISKVEDREIAFYDRLPESFRKCEGIPEVISPFKNNLMDSGRKRMDRGTFVEIKLGMPETDAGALLEFTQDGHGFEGTKKGFAEIFSGNIGMRGLNTFIGKARANRIFTPIVQAMDDLKAQGIEVIPVNGAYLQYWVDQSVGEGAGNIVQKAIAARINSGKYNGVNLDLDFKPIVSTIAAGEIDLQDVRARFILDSMGKRLYPVDVLENGDFMINFVENIRRDVQNSIYQRLAKSEKRLADFDYIEVVRKVCACDNPRGAEKTGRRTIRDSEDFIWTLRNDSELPADMQSRKDDIERWFFEFAWEKVEKIRLFLAEEIQKHVGLHVVR